MNNFYVYKWSTEKDGVFYVGKGKDNRITASHKRSPLCYNIEQKRLNESTEIRKKFSSKEYTANQLAELYDTPLSTMKKVVYNNTWRENNVR